MTAKASKGLGQRWLQGAYFVELGTIKLDFRVQRPTYMASAVCRMILYTRRRRQSGGYPPDGFSVPCTIMIIARTSSRLSV